MPSTTTASVMAPNDAAHTISAAPLRERPRARNRSTAGAKTAATTTATAIVAVTIHRSFASRRIAPTKSAIAMSRHPTAALLASQGGTAPPSRSGARLGSSAIVWLTAIIPPAPSGHAETTDGRVRLTRVSRLDRQAHRPNCRKRDELRVRNLLRPALIARDSPDGDADRRQLGPDRLKLTIDRSSALYCDRFGVAGRVASLRRFLSHGRGRRHKEA